MNELIAATAGQVADAERAIDASLEAMPLPANEYFQALWHFLTVSEDLPRLFAVRSSGKISEHGDSDEVMRLSSIIDDNKYALRYVMDVIARRLPRAKKLLKKIKTGEVPYTTASRSLTLARDYRSIVGIFTFYHSGNAQCTIDKSGNHLWITFPNHAEEYVALDYALGIQETSSNVVSLVIAWLTFPSMAPRIAREISDSVVASHNDRLAYSFDVNMARDLVRTLPNSESWNLVPENWVFPWGSRTEVMSLWNSLLVRCAYQVLAINFGASRLNITGGGVDDLCLRISRGELVQNMQRLCQAPLDRIVSFVRGITYGRATRTPDPALQPLIPSGENELLVPCLHVLLSKGARNLLSLHARLDKKSFNSRSALFEQAMVSQLAGLAASRFPFVRTQFFFAPAGEIDLIIVDDQSATILVAELRWMIPPGDAREAVNRVKVCREKIVKVERKVSAVKKNLVTFLQNLGCNTSSSIKWEVVGFVVTENFAHRSCNLDIPMVPMAVLRIGLSDKVNARQLYLWLKSETWLPKKGTHFEVLDEHLRFGQYTVTHRSVSNPRPMQYKMEFLPASLKRFGVAGC